MSEEATLCVLAGLPAPQPCSLDARDPDHRLACAHVARYGDAYDGARRGIQNYCRCCAKTLELPSYRLPSYNCDGSLYHDG